MITKWCIVVSDLAEEEFFLVGPFDSKAEAEEFEGQAWNCEAITSIHPFIPEFKWISGNHGSKVLLHLFSGKDIKHKAVRDRLFQAVTPVPS